MPRQLWYVTYPLILQITTQADRSGGVITAGRTDGYCDTDDFKTKLTDCLNCAVEFDIWKYYGGSVSKAATACGLDATPVETSSASTEVSSTSTEASSTSAEASATSAEETSTATSASATTTEESVNSAVTTDAVTSPTGTTVASTSVSPPRVSGSSRPSSLIPSATPAGTSVGFSSTFLWTYS